MFSFTLDNKVLIATFSDPSSRNAFSLKAARALHERIQQRDFDALVLRAEGRVFCSGGQLSDYALMPTAEDGRAVNGEIRATLATLAALPVPAVACVTGDAFGGGVELISCFDLILAAPHVIFGLWQRKIGLSYGWGGGARLEKRLGPGALSRLALTTNPICAREALELGLVDQLVQESELSHAATSAARTLAGLPLEPLEALKSFDSSKEAEIFNKLWWNDSHRAVLAARNRTKS